MTEEVGILLYLLYLLLEIFLVLFLGIPFAATGVGFALTQVDDWIIGTPVFLAIAALVFWGAYKLGKRRRSASKEAQEAQQRATVYNTQLQAREKEAKRALEVAEQERDSLKTEVQMLREKLRESDAKHIISAISPSPSILRQDSAADGPPSIKETTSTEESLTHPEAQALKFWNKKRTDFIVPSYYSDSAFGKTVSEALPKFLDLGYLSFGDVRQRISLKTVPELKAILADYELKTSGTKSELITRIIDNLSIESIEEIFPVNVYQITEKGNRAIAQYSLMEKNDQHALGLSYYRLMHAKEIYPKDDDNVILTRLLSEDIQNCYMNQDKIGFQHTITIIARFMEEIGEFDSALKASSLSFFIWSITSKSLNENEYSRDQQNYYLAKNLERIGSMCGYDLDELLLVVKETICQTNPFSLATPQNVNCAIQSLVSAWGINTK